MIIPFSLKTFVFFQLVSYCLSSLLTRKKLFNNKTGFYEVKN